MPTYATLKRAHPTYDAALYQELELLYEGGYEILKHAASILRRQVDEPPAIHEERCANASYIPYLGQIVDQLTAWLFTDQPDIRPAADAANPDTPGELPDPDFYGEFASNADRTGLSFVDMLRQAMGTAILKRRAIIGVDLPKVDPVDAETFRSRADEKEAGVLRAYLYEVPIEQLIHWDKRPDGSFKWAVVHTVSQPQDGPLDPADVLVEEFKVWTLGPDGAHWDLYRITYKPDDRPEDDAVVPLVDGGDTTFTTIPLVELELPKGLWAGNKIGPLAREHFRERSRLMSSEAKSLDEIPVIGLGSEMGAMGGALPSEMQQDPNRGNDTATTWKRRGYAVLGAGDTLEFKGPSGVAFALKNQQLAELKDEIFRVVHLMAASVSNNKSAALGRSGLAKQQDKDDTSIVLTALGAKGLSMGLRIYNVVSTARGDDVVWEGKGLSEYTTEDRDQLVAEAVQMEAIDIPSPTWRAAYKTDIALRLTPGLSSQAQAQVRKEITDGVGHESELHSLMHDAQRNELDQRVNGVDPTAATAGATGAPPAGGGASGGGLTPPGGTPQPGGATKDGKVSDSKAAKMAGTPSEAASGPMALVASSQLGATLTNKPTGPAGQPLLPENAHHQTGAHVDAQTVYELVVEDYREKDIQWIKTVPWMGPVEVPLSTIDFTNVDRWQASQPEDADHVQHFVDKLTAGDQLKPVVLVNNPSNDAKFVIVDGHHRSLAAMKVGRPVVAYVGQVGSDTGDWSAMHDSQKGLGTSNQRSRQVSQQSAQVSRQKKK